MINCTYRPLINWPRPVTSRSKRKSKWHFKAGWADTLDKLEHELRMLAAKDIVIQIEISPSDIRNDGAPRSNAKINDARVAISFTSRYGQLTYHCDDCEFWQHNVRCIAMTLERLRGAEMYGVTKRGEQYQGFKGLPGSIEVGPAGMTLEMAVADVCRKGGGNPDLVRNHAEYFQKSYRSAAMACHPDRHPELTADWNQLQEAADLLKKHHHLA